MGHHNNRNDKLFMLFLAGACLYLLGLASGCATASRTLSGLDQNRCDDVQLNHANNRMSMCNRSGFDSTACFADAIVSSCEAP